MPRGFGTPREAVLGVQRYWTPAEIGYNATPYGGGLQASSVLLVEGFAAFSLYIILTAALNNEIFFTVKNDTGLANLAQVQITAAHVGAVTYRHWPFGQGSALPVVARELFFEVRNAGWGAGNVTAWLFARGV